MPFFHHFLAHLAQRAMWDIAITWHPSSVHELFHILIFSSETTWPHGTKLGSKHLCKVLYKVLHFVPFHQQIWPPRAILVSDWLLFKKVFSETAWQNGAKLGRKHLCKVQTWHRWSLGVSDSSTFHSRWLLFFKVMIISLWNLLQYHSIVRWAIQAQWAEPLVSVAICSCIHRPVSVLLVLDKLLTWS